MIYLKREQLKAGMVLARNLTRSAFFLPLLTKNQVLTSTIIKKMEQHNIPGAYIESDIAEGIELPDFFDGQMQRELSQRIRNVYEDIGKTSNLTSQSYAIISNLSDGVVKSILSDEECLVNVIDMKDYDNYTYMHCTYVAVISALIGYRLGYSVYEINNLAVCGFLHDVGKLDVSLDIINKCGPLSEGEFRIIKKHPEYAWIRLRSCYKISEEVLAAITSHHEKYDGTGYPKELKGKEIPIYGRILAVADVFDALVSNRPYRVGIEPHLAIEYILDNTGTHFDPEIIEAFLQCVVAYPVGSFIKLTNGELAIVKKSNPEHIFRPQIRILQPQEKRGVDIDLATDHAYADFGIEEVVKDIDCIDSEVLGNVIRL